MAEQRPYRVPGFSADARLARAKRLAMLSLAGAFIAINWVTTQHAANVLRHASWLGRPLFHLRSEAVYAPWSWIVWWTRWYWAPQLEPLWEQCAREALYPMAIVTAVSCAAIAMVRHGWFANVSDLHGSARWATTRDLRAARLIDARSSVRDRLREIGVRMRILSPAVRRAGIYLGLWRQWGRASYIRDCGPAHVLVFAPTRSGKGVGIVIPTLLTLAALGTGSRSQRGKLGAHGGSAQTDGSGLSQVCAGLSRQRRRTLQPARRGQAPHPQRDPRRS